MKEILEILQKIGIWMMALGLVGLFIWIVLVGYENRQQPKYRIITINSCQYIEAFDYPPVPLVHLGDCSNPIHK